LRNKHTNERVVFTELSEYSQEIPVAHSLPRFIVAFVATCTLAIAVGSCSGPTEEEPVPPGISPCDPAIVSNDQLVIDFQPHLSQTEIAQFAHNFDLQLINAIYKAPHSFLFQLTGVGDDAVALARILRESHDDFVAFAERPIHGYDLYNGGADTIIGAHSTDRILAVFFHNDPTPQQIDSIAQRHHLLPYPESMWPGYVRRLLEGWVYPTVAFLIDRNEIPPEIVAECLASNIYVEDRQLQSGSPFAAFGGFGVTYVK
jgi:hypothetical protein